LGKSRLGYRIREFLFIEGEATLKNSMALQAREKGPFAGNTGISRGFLEVLKERRQKNEI